MRSLGRLGKGAPHPRLDTSLPVVLPGVGGAVVSLPAGDKIECICKVKYILVGARAAKRQNGTELVVGDDALAVAAAVV
jgi:hypothetical protein